MNHFKPNFFILGAPKSGTTSLYAYLSDHPEIVMSNPKEPHYFSTDIENGGIKSLDEYLACFDSLTESAKAIGDASTLYLYSKVAVREILKFNKNARFIVMLRDPSEIALSFHQVALRVFGETEMEFNRAWDLQEERAKGINVPDGCPDPQLFAYGKIAKLGFQVERLLSLVDPDAVHFVFFHDFKESTEQEFLNVLRFLGLDSSFDTKYDVHNPTRRIKYPRITQLVNRAIGIKKKVGIETEFGFAKKIHRANIEEKPLEQLNPEVYKKMTNFYDKDLKLLSSLVEKDLSAWRFVK